MHRDGADGRAPGGVRGLLAARSAAIVRTGGTGEGFRVQSLAVDADGAGYIDGLALARCLVHYGQGGNPSAEEFWEWAGGGPGGKDPRSIYFTRYPTPRVKNVVLTDLGWP